MFAGIIDEGCVIGGCVVDVGVGVAGGCVVDVGVGVADGCVVDVGVGVVGGTIDPETGMYI